MEPNSIKFPEAWRIFIDHARNMENTPEESLGKYRIANPDMSGHFLYSNCPGMLFWLFKEEYYKPRINSPSLYGKIQYIVENF